MEYAYESFRRGVLRADASFRGGPRPGEPFPDFALPTADGRRARKADYVGRPLFVTLGSITCPMTRSAAPLLHHMYEKYGPRVAFLSLYVREAHPGERFPQPKTMIRKIDHARAYQQRDHLPWPVAVDLVDGHTHRMLDGHQSPAFFVGPDGRVVFRSLWSNDERALRRGFEALIGEGKPGAAEPRLRPMLAGTGVMHETLSASGPKARRDALRQAPPLYALAALARLFRPLPPIGRGVAASVVGAGLLGLAGYGTYRAFRAGRAGRAMDRRRSSGRS
jgi:hypothetical protein